MGPWTNPNSKEYRLIIEADPTIPFTISLTSRPAEYAFKARTTSKRTKTSCVISNCRVHSASCCPRKSGGPRTRKPRQNTSRRWPSNSRDSTKTIARSDYAGSTVNRSSDIAKKYARDLGAEENSGPGLAITGSPRPSSREAQSAATNSANRANTRVIASVSSAPAIMASGLSPSSRRISRRAST